MRPILALLLAVSAIVMSPITQAGSPAMSLLPAEPDELWQTSGGHLEATADGGYRWHLEPGQEATLEIRQDHPLLANLRDYDYLTFEFRIASGEVSGSNLNILGHVSGPRQYKVHDWQVAVLTTEKAVWHRRHYELARPNWFPWDDPNGQGRERFLRFTAVALMPDTVVELRGMRISPARIRLKPDFITPVTWPVLSRDDAGNAVYTLEHQVINQSNEPTTITPALLSAHDRFQVTVEPAVSELVMNGKTAKFTVTATLPLADEQALPELYAEDLRLSFTPADDADSTLYWQGRLVRPLGPDTRRQVLMPPADVELLRTTLSTDADLRKLVKADAIIKSADGFKEKELLRIPTGHLHVSNNWMGDWRPADRMPEIINTTTGEKQFDTPIAARTWKEYMGIKGAMENLAYAYLFTGDETYAQKAIELFELYAQQYTDLSWDDFFSPPWSTGDAMLSSSRVALSSTYGTNWYFKGHCQLFSAIADSPSWDDASRQRVYRRFVLPYATELMKFDGGISNMTDVTNRNLLLLGLTFRDAGLVYHALYSDPGLVRRLHDLTPDGFSSEGRPVNYHYAAMAEYLAGLYYLENAQLQADYPRDRLLAAIRMPYYRAALTGIVPNTGDLGRGFGVRNQREADWLIGIFPEETWLLDLGSHSTLAAQLQAYRSNHQKKKRGWPQLLDTKPRHFPDGGYAILRSGETVDEQVMATLDYGRNVMHAHLDRNTISLHALGHIYSHGPGSLYNVGRGGITRNAELNPLITSRSLAQNVVLVNQQDQQPAVGSCLLWQDQPERQAVVARVPGIRPGVDHTRALVLVDGIVVVIDRLDGQEDATYDWVYHNFGACEPGEGWSASDRGPIGETADYLVRAAVRELKGDGPLRLHWQVAEGAHLALWALPPDSAYVVPGALNNAQTGQIPQAAPALVQRKTGRSVHFLTVLEPYAEQPRVTGIAPHGDDGLRITLRDGQSLQLSLTGLLSEK